MKKICKISTGRSLSLGEKFNKPVVATCDVHFLDPEDEVYRRIIMAGKGFADADNQPPLYLRTTEEMLEEFEYLGSAKARRDRHRQSEQDCRYGGEDLAGAVRISVRRSSKIRIRMLREICYNKAHEMYGEELPPVVTERLETRAELHYFQRIRCNVYHCAEAGMEIQ